jgi:hypothetical protein
MKLLLTLGAAAVAFTAAPASARHSNHGYRYHARACAKWRHGHCVRWENHGYAMSTARHARYKVGYRFGPSYAYTNVSALPNTYVRRYDLNGDYRYVYRDNYIYVVDPQTYAVTRVINALTGR